MTHIDENTNAKYCSICKNRVAMAEALHSSTFVCDQCVDKIGNIYKDYEIVKTEGIYDGNMQTSKLQ